jgi:bifunctional DNase/RNase
MSTGVPMTHDLMKMIIDRWLTVELLAIPEFRGEAFKGVIRLSLNGTQHDFSARPSDVAALACRLEMPIFTSVEIMERYGLLVPEE